MEKLEELKRELKVAEKELKIYIRTHTKEDINHDPEYEYLEDRYNSLCAEIWDIEEFFNDIDDREY